MSYNITIKEKGNHIRVEVTGKRIPGKEVEDAGIIWSQVSEICRTKNIDKILLVSKVTGPLSFFASFNIAATPKDYGWSNRFTLAAVIFDEKARKGYLFSETVADNRMFVLKIFDNEQDAKTWLFEA